MAKARNLSRGFSDPGGDNEATFSLVSDEATFEVVGPPDVPTPVSAEEEQSSVQRMLEREGIASAESAFLAGERKYVISSNVSWIEYHWLSPEGSPVNLLYIGYRDGSVYEYEGVPFEVARAFYNASSYGKFTWDAIRVRGTVFGTQYPYRLVSGSRIWHDAGSASQARHEAIPKSGEPFKGYHPSFAYEGAPGTMGNRNARLNKKRGQSKKVAAFIHPDVKFGGFGATGPFSGK